MLPPTFFFGIGTTAINPSGRSPESQFDMSLFLPMVTGEEPERKSFDSLI
jgi:hypothetical protein